MRLPLNLPLAFLKMDADKDERVGNGSTRLPFEPERSRVDGQGKKDRKGKWDKSALNGPVAI